MATRFCVVMIAAPAGRVSRKIADILLKGRLAACVNILPAVESRYWWEGKLRKGREALLLVKTRRSLLAKVEEKVAAAHPYCTPEIVSLPFLRGNAPYLRWIDAETKKR